MGKLIKELAGLAFARHSVRIAWIISVVLLAVGYLTPPLGDMPEWVIPAIGWAFAFASLAAAVGGLESGLAVRLSKGDAELQIGKDVN
ncbi:MAG: hypothetical protein KBS70_08235 [Bacteroidales bacterium]|nr:hypothetical protein [Candidatus Colicola equi]MBQ0154750.1 hypothetical protein [Candidatus Colicola equi]